MGKYLCLRLKGIIMEDFLRDKLMIDFDGNWNLSEIAGAAILLVLAVLMLLGIIALVKRIVKTANPRKDTIFSHRKNRYKTSIGKKKKNKY